MRATAKTRSQLCLDFSARHSPPPPREETFEEALELTFPAGDETEEYLYREFLRLFPD